MDITIILFLLLNETYGIKNTYCIIFDEFTPPLIKQILFIDRVVEHTCNLQVTRQVCIRREPVKIFLNLSHLFKPGG